MKNMISNNIKYYRKKAGLTQAELANMSNVSQMSIRRYEAGSREPSLASLNDIAKALKIPVSKLVAFDTLPNVDIELFSGSASTR